ncbi:MAG: aconitase X catalytic domain-containing protein [Sulfolobales archaeon]
MYLTKIEEKMYNGEYGEYVSKAIRIIVKVGESLNASRLINIRHAHISGVGYSNLGDAGLTFLKDLARENVKFRTYTTANPGSVDIESYNYFSYGEEFLKKQIEILELYRSMGVNTFTCTPYHIRTPRFGEHLAWAESNAVLIANSIYGARTNREAGPLALFSAIVGKTYYSGVHIKSGRIPRIRFLVRDLKDSFVEAGLLGLMIGRISRDKIALLSGASRLGFERLKTLLAAAGSTGSMSMILIEGVTPMEIPMSEILENIEDTIVIDRKDIKIYHDEEPFLCDDPEAYLIGCPHNSIEVLKELRNIATRFSGKTSKPVWVLIPPEYESNQVIRDDLEFLRSKGFIILKGICPVISPLSQLGFKCIGTISSKALFYMPKLSGVKVRLLDLYDLVAEAFNYKTS